MYHYNRSNILVNIFLDSTFNIFRLLLNAFALRVTTFHSTK